MEHSSIIRNHQQSPPTYIYTNPHNYNIQQFHPCTHSPSHIFIYDITHQLFKCM